MKEETKQLLANWLAQFTPEFINKVLAHMHELMDNDIFVIILTKWNVLRTRYESEYADYVMECINDELSRIPEDAYFWKYTHKDERAYNDVLMHIIKEICGEEQ